MNITRRDALKGIGALTIGAQLGGPVRGAARAQRGAGAFDVAAIERDRVIKAANAYMKERPITITASSSPRSAGGRHDFFSEGDYWWPDPQNPGGPYIQRDGMTNPDNFVEHRRALMRFSVQMPALVAAWKLTGEMNYARHASRHLRVWFIEPDTKMNPHLLYAQAIHGRFTGRGIGIIDTIHLVEVARAIEVIRRSAAPRGRGMEDDRRVVRRLSALDDDAQVRAGRARREEQSRHVLGDAGGRLRASDEERGAAGVVPRALQDRAAAGTARHGRQLPAGSEAHQAVLLLAVQPRSDGDDLPDRVDADDNLWTFELKEPEPPSGRSMAGGEALGRGMRLAMNFMTPYFRDKSKWPYPRDVMYDEHWPMRQQSLLFAGLALDRPADLELWKTLPADSTVEEVVRNYFIRQPVLWV